MNLTNDAGKHDNEKNSSSDDEDERKAFDNPPSIRIEHFLSDNEHEELDSSENDDDDDDAESDIENHCYSKSRLSTPNRLTTLLRQSNRLVELKINLCHQRLINNQHRSLRHALSDSDMSKRSHHYQHQEDQQQSIRLSSVSSNNFHLATNRSHRLYLPSSFLYELQSQITHWLQASTHLIDSVSTAAYHRRCWPQLLLTYLIETHSIHLEFLRCTHSLSLTTVDDESCSIHKHGCVLEEDAYRLCSILQKGSRLPMDAIIFDHMRRIIVIKSMQEGRRCERVFDRRRAHRVSFSSLEW